MGADPTKPLELLNSLCNVLEPVGTDVFGSFETIARQRLASRDPEDWPMLASALATFWRKNAFLLATPRPRIRPTTPNSLVENPPGI
jgi:hypothetical protein